MFRCLLAQSEVVPPKPTMLSRAAALVPRNVTAASSRNAQNGSSGETSGVELTSVPAPSASPSTNAATRPAASTTNQNSAPVRERYQRPHSTRARDVQSLMDRGYTEAVAVRSLELALGDLDMAVLLAVPVSQAAQTTPPVLSSPASPTPGSPEASSTRTSRESSEGPRSTSSRLVPATPSGGSSDDAPSRSRSRSLSRSSAGSRSVASSTSASSSPPPTVPRSSVRNQSNSGGAQPTRIRTTPGRSGVGGRSRSGGGRGGGRSSSSSAGGSARARSGSASSTSGRGRVASSRTRPVVDL